MSKGSAGKQREKERGKGERDVLGQDDSVDCDGCVEGPGNVRDGREKTL